MKEYFGQGGKYHPINPFLIFDLFFMQAFNIESKTPIFDLKSYHNKTNIKVPDLNKGAQHEIQHGSRSPHQELNKLIIIINNQSQQSNKAERIHQTQWILGPVKVPIYIENVVAIIGKDERMHNSPLVHNHNTDGDQE